MTCCNASVDQLKDGIHTVLSSVYFKIMQADIMSILGHLADSFSSESLVSF